MWNADPKALNIQLGPKLPGWSRKAPAPPFPYSTVYAHHIDFDIDKTPDAHRLPMDQQWSMSEPGPCGFIVGKIGIGSLSGLHASIEVCARRSCRLTAQYMRVQAGLNRILDQILDPNDVTTPRFDDVDDDELEFMLNDIDRSESNLHLKSPLTVVSESAAITLTIRNHSIKLTMPMPQTVTVTNSAPLLKLYISISPYNLAGATEGDKDGKEESGHPLKVTWDTKYTHGDEPRGKQEERIDTDVRTGVVGGWDVVDVVKRIELALRKNPNGRLDE